MESEIHRLDSTISQRKRKKLFYPNTIANLKLNQCIRKFELPQQFPSRTTDLTKVNTKRTLDRLKLATVSQNNLPVANSIKQEQKKLETIKIQSKDGRDLGEIKVEILSAQNNILKGRALAITNARRLKCLQILKERQREKSNATTSHLPINKINTNDIPSVISATVSTAAPKLFCAPVLTCKNTVDKDNSNERSITNTKFVSNETLDKDNSTIDFEKRSKESFQYDIKKNFNYKNRDSISHPNIMKNIETVPFNRNLVMMGNKSTNAENVTLSSSSTKIRREKILNLNKSQISDSHTYLSNDSSSVQNISSNFNALKIFTDEHSIQHNDQKRNFNAMRKNVMVVLPKNKITSENSIENVSSSCISNIHSKQKQIIAEPELDNKKIVRFQMDTEGIIEPQMDIEGIIEPQMDTEGILVSKIDFRQLCAPKMNAKDVDCQMDIEEIDKSQINKEKRIAEPEMDLQGIVSNDCFDDNYSILKKALHSVKDISLKKRALQALNECGIRKPRTVSIRLNQNLKSIADSQIQTQIFGLLEENNFIKVTEEEADVQRIQEKKCDIDQFNELIMKPFSTNNTFSEQNQNSDFTMELEVEKLLNIYSKSENTNKIKVLLDKSNESQTYKKIYTQLKNDFENMKTWNENGLLPIHKAVIMNQIHDVNRQILILKTCRQNIDIETKDNETSLELAFKTEASENIIKLLLQEGAQPAINNSFKESAIFIACRKNSISLPELLKYVKDKSLLNQVNSEGLAPIHICSRQGNLVGVECLIRAGADVNIRDRTSGRTALFHAMENRYIEVANLLISNNADSNIPNFSGQIVLSLVDDTRSSTFLTALKKNLNSLSK